MPREPTQPYAIHTPADQSSNKQSDLRGSWIRRNPAAAGERCMSRQQFGATCCPMQRFRLGLNGLLSQCCASVRACICTHACVCVHNSREVSLCMRECLSRMCTHKRAKRVPSSSSVGVEAGDSPLLHIDYCLRCGVNLMSCPLKPCFLSVKGPIDK